MLADVCAGATVVFGLSLLFPGTFIFCCILSNVLVSSHEWPPQLVRALSAFR